MALRFPRFSQGLAQDPTTRRIWFGIEEGTYVAENTTTGVKYLTLEEAFNAANTNETITLLTSSTGKGLSLSSGSSSCRSVGSYIYISRYQVMV